MLTHEFSLGHGLIIYVDSRNSPKKFLSYVCTGFLKSFLSLSLNNNKSPNADIQISAIKIFADRPYANIEKRCPYADIADADINIGTSLLNTDTE